MDSFEWNKIAGWVLTAAIAVLGLILVTGEIYKPEKPAKPGYVVEGVEEVAAAGPAAPAEKPVEFFLASASVDKGAEIFKKCGACHNAEKGGAAGIGPNLYGVVGGPHDHMPGFSYSDAMEKTAGQKWDWDELNKWLTNPKGYVPGTKMAFAGIGKVEDRAAVIAYLNSKSDHPLPLPPVPKEDTAAPATAAGATDAATKQSATATVAGADGKTAGLAGPPTADNPAPQPGKAPDIAPGSTKAHIPDGTSRSVPTPGSDPK